MTATITAYGGVSEVGGNKFLLRTCESGSSVFLDFGQSFDEEKKFFDQPFLRPRDEKVLRMLKILPEIPGFYKDSDPSQIKNVEAILVSHAHLDHYSYIRYVSDAIPIVTGPATERIIVAREETGAGYSEDYRIAKCSKTTKRNNTLWPQTDRTSSPTFLNPVDMKSFLKVSGSNWADSVYQASRVAALCCSSHPWCSLLGTLIFECSCVGTPHYEACGSKA